MKFQIRFKIRTVVVHFGYKRQVLARTSVCVTPRNLEYQKVSHCSQHSLTMFCIDNTPVFYHAIDLTLDIPSHGQDPCLDNDGEHCSVVRCTS